MRFLLAGFLFVLMSNAASADLYGNARFGYFVEVPDSVSSRKSESENGDGASFRSADGLVMLTTYGAWLQDQNYAQAFTLLIKYAKQDGWNVSYQRISPKGFGVYSGSKAGRIFYGRAVPSCGGKAIVTYQIEYPVVRRRMYDAILKRLNASLKAGQGTCG